MIDATVSKYRCEILMEAAAAELGLSWGCITLLQTGEKHKLVVSCEGCCIFSPAVYSLLRDNSFITENEKEVDAKNIIFPEKTPLDKCEDI